MTAGTVAAGALVGAAVLALRRPAAGERLTGILPSTGSTVAAGRSGRRVRIGRPEPAGRSGRRGEGARPAGRPAAVGVPTWVSRAVAVFAGVAAGVLVGGWPGVVAAVSVAVVLPRLLRRLEPAAVRAERAAAAAALPYAVDLLAAALRAGAPIDAAVLAVADALGGPLGGRLRRIGHALRLGTPPPAAWEPLGDLDEAAPVVRAAVRSAESGAALAGACTRAAAAVRAGRDARLDAAAQRAGVLVVLPLGCCFLPAFVLVGVVPIVLGVLDDVLA